MLVGMVLVYLKGISCLLSSSFLQHFVFKAHFVHLHVSPLVYKMERVALNVRLLLITECTFSLSRIDKLAYILGIHWFCNVVLE
ncbi:hypothetical protein M758_UG284800 [Ceratodon purpureus]|nr:hypothetical protein M758_UG284800 [Ceratodon purpureus]